MANLKENAAWESGIYQLETTDPVVGGVDGISNKQAIQLANRTSYLKGEIETLKSKSNTQLALKRDISDSYSKTQTAALIAPKLDSAIAEATYLKKTDKIDAYTKRESDDKFALKTSLPALATETKAGITKLKNAITAKQEDVAVTEKAVREFVDNSQNGLGVGQTYKKVWDQRDLNTYYPNTTNKPILVCVSIEANNTDIPVSVIVDEIMVLTSDLDNYTNYNFSFIVPAGSKYKLATLTNPSYKKRDLLTEINNEKLNTWSELS